ncbi:hypothetical protein TSUD_42830 [Trifolium subterraneum]|uniref:Cellulose synthase n=1 Tax=Trifolium subterraneum TaxID=3900 RepID=A0A2Z6MJR7_TRISU|nr:hypothetical protein TSUD_42830 [Trifolium subterraneum]
MDTNGRLVTGSHNRNEFVLINADETARVNAVTELSNQICQICGDEIEVTVDGEPFVACNECAFPVCRPCYEYERREGNQACPHCKTKYKRIKGSPRVEGDEEEDDADDLENEFDIGSNIRHDVPHHIVEVMLSSSLNNIVRSSQMNTSGITTPSELDSASVAADIPRLTYDHEDLGISSDKRALIIPPFKPRGKRVYPMPFPRPMDPNKDLAVYGYGSVAWKERVEEWKKKRNEKLEVVKHKVGNSIDENCDEVDDPDLPKMDEGRQPLWRKLPISPSKINPYRIIIVLRIAVLGLFFHYRILHPVNDAYTLWLTSVICEIWFAVSWILDQFPKWSPIERETYLDRLSLRYEKEGKKCELADIDRDSEEFKVRINALVAMAQKIPEDGWTMQDGTPWPGNNVIDHPGMIQVFLGQNGVRDIEGNELPRLVYVSREKRPGFEHHKKAGAMNALVRVSAIISNAPYMLNVDCDHYINNSKALREAMCFMMDPTSGKKICYVQFPQRFDGIDRHDRYSNRNVVFFDINMKGLDGIQGPIYVGTGCVFRRLALYGYDAPATKKPPRKTCNCWPKWCFMCCGSRKKYRKVNSGLRKKKMNKDAAKQIHALETIEEGIEGIDNEKSSIMSQLKFEKKYGQSSVFIASTLMEDGGILKAATSASLLKEAIHVISCGYEDKTEWGKEVGWIYGSVTEDILTGFKMHSHGWRSVYCMPKRPAFKGSAPINLSDRLHQVLRWALGSVEIMLSRHCPIWYGYGCGLKWLERFSYINSVVYPLTSIPLIAYCTLPAVCLLTGKFIVPEISNYASIIFIALFISIAATSILEMKWGGVGIHDWWRNEQFWVIGGASSHLFALFQGLLKVLAGVNTNFTVTSKAADDGDFADLYIFKWTSLLIPPLTLLILNIIGVIVGVSDAINNGYDQWRI